MAKSMGSFIAALRTASGMTQRELADKLNVSDKTVSRWERDINAPDLSLLPILADLFGVSCDELLRGERTSAQRVVEPEKAQAKAEVQVQRLLDIQRNKVTVRTVIAAGIALMGLLAALIINHGFLRARIAFFTALALYLVALIWQGVVCIQALAVPGTSDAEAVPPYRRFVIQLSLRLAGLVLVLFAITLPLSTLAEGVFNGGLLTESWLPAAIWYGMCGFLVACVLYRAVQAWLVHQGKLIPENTGALPPRAWQLRALVAVATAIALGLSISSVPRLGFARLSDYIDGQTFDTFEAFRAYVETEDTGFDSPEYGPEALTVYDSEGKEKVVYEYQVRNWRVYSIEWNYSNPEGRYLPVTVFTYENVQKYETVVQELARVAPYRHAWILGLGMALWVGIGYIYRKREAKV